MTRVAIGTKQNYVTIDIGATGVWVNIHNNRECFGWYFERDYRNVRIVREGKDLKIAIGGFRYWVKAKRIY